MLGDDAPLFAAAYGVTEAGNWEGVTILSRVATDEALAERFGLSGRRTSRTAARGRHASGSLRAGRAARSLRATTRSLAAWNGLAIAAFADAAVALASDEPDARRRYRAAAETRRGDGRRRPAVGRRLAPVGRGRTAGRSARACSRTTPTWLTGSSRSTRRRSTSDGSKSPRALMDRVLAHFADPAGGFFDTADDHERLVTRPKDVQDNAVPSGNAMAARVLLRLAAWTGEGRYRDAAERALRTVVPFVARYPTGLRAVAVGDGPRACAGRRGRDRRGARGSGDRRPDRRGRGAVSGPNQVRRVAPDPAASVVPLLADRVAIDGRPTAYVCRGFVCRLPVTDAERAREQLDARGRWLTRRQRAFTIREVRPGRLRGAGRA